MAASEEGHADGALEVVGRSAHQGPDVDGATVLAWPAGVAVPTVGSLVPARVVDAQGVDLVAEPVGVS